jgi:hypothetical protein
LKDLNGAIFHIKFAEHTAKLVLICSHKNPFLHFLHTKEISFGKPSTYFKITINLLNGDFLNHLSI